MNHEEFSMERLVKRSKIEMTRFYSVTLNFSIGKCIITYL